MSGYPKDLTETQADHLYRRYLGERYEDDMDKKHCRGCRNDFYNGKNGLGVKECWNLKGARLVSRIAIGHWENPPYLNKKKVKVPRCWHGEGPSRTHYIDPSKDLDERGYWK